MSQRQEWVHKDIYGLLLPSLSGDISDRKVTFHWLLTKNLVIQKWDIDYRSFPGNTKTWKSLENSTVRYVKPGKGDMRPLRNKVVKLGAMDRGTFLLNFDSFLQTDFLDLSHVSQIMMVFPSRSLKSQIGAIFDHSREITKSNIFRCYGFYKSNCRLESWPRGRPSYASCQEK